MNDRGKSWGTITNGHKIPDRSQLRDLPKMGKYQFSRELAIAVIFAMHLAEKLGSRTIDVRHWLSAIYIVAFEKLSKYWKESENLEDFVIDECGLTEPRLYYWVEAGKEFGTKKSPLLKLQSEELTSVLTTASELARSHGEGPESTGIICPEDFVLAVARHPEFDIGRKLLATGLDVNRLESALGRIRRRPG